MKWWYENEEREMEFDKSRVYTALNADELKQGDKVIVADTLLGLREKVANNATVCTIKEILGEDFTERFNVDIDWNRPLAYLVERAENCTNCEKHEDCVYVQNESKYRNMNVCQHWKPKTERAEKHYRPFADLRIGQEIYIRANISEIRKDYIICENAGGYFGTVREEIRCGVEE